jgi:hypothetical protein
MCIKLSEVKVRTLERVVVSISARIQYQSAVERERVWDIDITSMINERYFNWLHSYVMSGLFCIVEHLSICSIAVK